MADISTSSVRVGVTVARGSALGLGVIVLKGSVGASVIVAGRLGPAWQAAKKSRTSTPHLGRLTDLLNPFNGYFFSLRHLPTQQGHLARRAEGIASQPAVFTDDTVAGDQHRQGITADGIPNGTRRPGLAD